MKTLGSRIKAAREECGFLQSELASRIGVKSAGVISNWETDKSKPDADKIVQLCDVLDVSCSYLLDYYGSEDVSASESTLLALFRDLNEDGQQKVLDYAKDLHATGLYIKDVSSGVSETA